MIKSPELSSFSSETMGYRKTNVKRGGLRGSNRRGGHRKKRSSLVGKVYRQRPTARNQKYQIARVTRLAVANRKRFSSVFTDWQISPTSAPDDLGYGFNLAPAQWQTVRLTNFDQWEPVLRQNDNVNDSNHTFVKRIQVNLRANIIAGYATCNFFIVRTRFADANRDLFSDPPSVANGDFVENTNFPGANIRLNSNKFKVLASYYCTLRTHPVSVAPSDPNFVPGDPLPAEKRWQWTIHPNIKVHQTAFSSGGSVVPGKWPGKPFEDLPYYDRIYLMAYAQLDPNVTRGSWYADSLATCVNNL